MPIPDLPGQPLPRGSESEVYLKSTVARFCRLDHERFPGSQPVSFSTGDLAKLESQDFWVCEKSDGVRVLFFICPQDGEQRSFLIDRHNTYREVEGFYFPHYETPSKPLGFTLIDGELVIDVDPATNRETLRYLAFDCLVIDNQNVMSKTLDKRYGRMTEWFVRPYKRMLQDYPHIVEQHPFLIKVKETSLSYHVEKVFNVDIPALQHGNDGLIYTCVNTPYTPGTDTNILKWKPPSENSIDFKLVLRFPPQKYDPKQPDFHAKPIFQLHVWCGENRYELYDQLYVDDAEWEKLKQSGEQIDDRVVEVHWDPAASHWRMMRFRDDKPHGNHKSIVEKIIQSIADGVEKEALLERSDAVRAAWKARHGQQQAGPPPPGGSQRPPSSQTQPSRHGQFHPPRPGPPPSQYSQPPPSSHSSFVDFRYGPVATSPWSKVSGPLTIAGMKR